MSLSKQVQAANRSNLKAVAIGVVLGLAITGGIVACTSSGSITSTGQQTENQAAKQGQLLLVNNQPVPVFVHSQLRANLIELETAEAKGVQSTTFAFPPGATATSGVAPIWTCPSIGASIASTTELTNPQQVVTNSYPTGGAALNIDQMDPTGVYTGQSAGTWTICLNKAGKAYAIYNESDVTTVLAPAVWDTATRSIQIVGDPSFKFSGGK